MFRTARLLGLVVLVYAVLRLPVAASAEPGALTILQFNMCGSACETTFAVVADLEREIRGHRPEPYVVTLQEVCRGQYDRLIKDLRYAGHFEPTIRNRCWDGSDYGIAVLVRAGAGAVDFAGSWPLPAPAGGEPRRLACVRTTVRAGPLTACVTHLDTDSDNTASQVAAVAAHVDGRTVVGGDFNALPDDAAMRPMYDGMTEVGGPATGGCSTDRCGARPGWAHPTRKIDYIFGAFTGPVAVTTDAPHSDHVPLWATVTLT